MCHRLKDWSETNSGTDHLAGIQKMQEKIKLLFSELSPAYKQYPAASFEMINDEGRLIEKQVGDVLHFQKRPDAKYQILLCGHCDTVFEESHTFQTVSVMDENTWRGPGVSDMKGGILILFYALWALEQSPFKEHIGWQVFINADEEIGSLGSASILADIAKSAKIGFIFEPAMDESGTLAGMRKGSGNFSICVYGKAAHVGRAFHEGKNALVSAAKLAERLHNLNAKTDLIINVGRLKGGGALNIVPDFALLQLGVRTSNLESEKLFLDMLEKIIQSTIKEDEVDIKWHGRFNRKPKLIQDKTKALYDYVISQGNLLGLTLSVKSTGGCCDGNNLSALGIPNVDTLGVRGGKIHTSDEYIKLDSLIERAKLSALLLMGISAGKVNGYY